MTAYCVSAAPYLIGDLCEKEVDVFGYVQLILAAVSHQVSVQHVVALNENLHNVAAEKRTAENHQL